MPLNSLRASLENCWVIRAISRSPVARFIPNLRYIIPRLLNSRIAFSTHIIDVGPKSSYIDFMSVLSLYDALDDKIPWRISGSLPISTILDAGGLIPESTRKYCSIIVSPDSSQNPAFPAEPFLILIFRRCSNANIRCLQ